MRAVPVHIALPLVALGLTRSRAIDTDRSLGAVSISSLGRFVINVVLSAGVIGLGIMATVWLVKSEIFSNSVIIIGFVPIPGMVMVALPIVPAIIGILYIWGREG